jgi:ribosomal protein S18 acetylase RimI-like enzyme
MQILIQPLTEANLDAADIVLQAAYQSLSRKETLRLHLQLCPESWIVAYLEERVVGLVRAIHYDPFAYIGMMGVHPDAQRRGVGKALLEYLLAWLDQQKCPTVLLDATADGAALHTHFGFVDDSQVIHWQRSTDDLANMPQPLWLTHTPSQTRLASLRQQDMSAIARFDAPFFGADRTSVLQLFLSLYAERAFLTAKPLDLFGSPMYNPSRRERPVDPLEGTEITRGVDGQITGYLIAQQNTLGAWVANNRQDAEALLRQALTLPFQKQATVLAPANNEAAFSLLKHYGFMGVRTLRHMRRGQPVTSQRREDVYGQVSFALG